jgi:hypothetical protein
MSKDTTETAGKCGGVANCTGEPVCRLRIGGAEERPICAGCAGRAARMFGGESLAHDVARLVYAHHLGRPWREYDALEANGARFRGLT